MSQVWGPSPGVNEELSALRRGEKDPHGPKAFGRIRSSTSRHAALVVQTDDLKFWARFLCQRNGVHHCLASDWRLRLVVSLAKDLQHCDFASNDRTDSRVLCGVPAIEDDEEESRLAALSVAETDVESRPTNLSHNGLEF